MCAGVFFTPRPATELDVQQLNQSLLGASQSGCHVQAAAGAHNTCSEGFTLHWQPDADLPGSAEGLAKVVPDVQLYLNGLGVDFLSGWIRKGLMKANCACGCFPQIVYCATGSSMMLIN